MSKKVNILTHGHCFDGLMSAVLFAHLIRHVEGQELSFSCRSCGYGPNLRRLPESWFQGDINAILDFRFGVSKRLDWYFDHHVTAFADAKQEDLARERSARGDLRLFYEPSYSSCAKLIVDVGRREFGARFDGLGDLIAWADKIDTASFASAADALDRSSSAMRLADIIEHRGDTPFYEDMFRLLLARPFDEVMESAAIREMYAPIESARNAFIGRVRDNADVRGPVVLVDLSDRPVEIAGKFITYALFPQSKYSVVLLRSKHHYKLSIGFNPWCGQPREHDIASLCKRFGGGGHPFVGAATFPLPELERARDAMRTAGDLLGA